jgi:hypothetical protein
MPDASNSDRRPPFWLPIRNTPDGAARDGPGKAANPADAATAAIRLRRGRE